MVHKLLKRLYTKYPYAAYVLTAVAVLLVVISGVLVWGVNKYWHPPKLVFTDADIAKTATVHTSKGDFTFELDTGVILPAAQFTRLAADGFYDSTRIHRVVPDLLIEMGDPLTRDVSFKHFWGEGGLANAFKNETHALDRFTEGTVAFTGSGSGTYGSQFFVVTRDTPWLKGKHTIIGHVVQGMDVVHAIERSAHLPTGLPVEDIVIISVTVNE